MEKKLETEKEINDVISLRAFVTSILFILLIASLIAKFFADDEMQEALRHNRSCSYFAEKISSDGRAYIENDPSGLALNAYQRCFNVTSHSDFVRSTTNDFINDAQYSRELIVEMDSNNKPIVYQRSNPNYTSTFIISFLLFGATSTLMLFGPLFFGLFCLYSIVEEVTKKNKST